MSLVSKYFKRSVELVVIRDIFNPQNNIESYQGHDIEQLLMQAFGGQGLSDSVRLYHGDLSKDITPKTPQDVDKIMRLNGRIYAVVKPMGLDPFTVALIVSVVVSVATAFLMPVPAVANQSANKPPSPNNALAARTNQQRLGGRIPDIFGTVWSVPDLIAPTYTVYVGSREIEYSYMCVGRGKYDAKKALDDTTPINQVYGSSVLIYDPDTNLQDEPSFVFGSQFSPNEALFSSLSVRRYTSVNGQLLPPRNDYLDAEGVVFKPPNIIELSGSSDADRFSAGNTILIEGADNLKSANNLHHQVVDNETGETVDSEPITYTLSGSYEISSITGNQLLLLNPSQVSSDWQSLTDNADLTLPADVVLSTNLEGLWQGWFYTNEKDHDSAMVNIRFPKGLFFSYYKGGYNPLAIAVEIETEVVDASGIPINGTSETEGFYVYGSSFDKYWERQGGTVIDGDPQGVPYKPDTGYSIDAGYPHDDQITESGGRTIQVTNSNLTQGKYLRFRIRRAGNTFGSEKHRPTTELRVADFYSYRKITNNDSPNGVTTVYTKTLATEGALSLKERKLRLLVQRYVTDATTGILKLSNRADDIARHIATDEKIGNLQLTQIDIAQIKTEIDNHVGYFGTDKCSQFCYTFDDNNLSAEETLQTLGKAVFGQFKRQGNKIMLDFERIVPASVAVFNSHNILPDTFTASQSLGIANDYDGVTVEYTDPADDATVTLSYPSDSLINPHEDKLIGVRNEVQAHMHMMRLYNKDRHAYKTCEFTAGDESNIVVRTNRITVADQLRANIQQGSVDSIETVGSDIVLYTTDPVSIEPSVPHTLFIQTINNGVEAIEVTARDDYSVTLARLPSGEISTGYDKVVQATYQIVTEEDKDRDAYLVSQKDPSEAMTNKLICTNYDDRYYQNDSDYINGLIT